MRFITLLTILASAFYASASDDSVASRKESLRGFIKDHNFVTFENDSISVTADSPQDLQNCIDSETWWVDANGDNCDWYRKNKSRCNKASDWINNDLDATDVCCACKGGTKPNNSKCRDDKNWSDAKSNKCSWYASRNPNKVCGSYARKQNKGGYNANDLCCICGGSRKIF